MHHSRLALDLSNSFSACCFLFTGSHAFGRFSFGTGTLSGSLLKISIFSTLTSSISLFGTNITRYFIIRCSWFKAMIVVLSVLVKLYLHPLSSFLDPLSQVSSLVIWLHLWLPSISVSRPFRISLIWFNSLCDHSDYLRKCKTMYWVIYNTSMRRQKFNRISTSSLPLSRHHWEMKS